MDGLLKRLARVTKRRAYELLVAPRLRRQNRAEWEAKWERDDFDAPWLGRGVSPEIAEAIESGWFPAGSSALDIGCGQGEVAAYLAGRGFPCVGVDIAEAAIARARKRFPERAGRLEFFTHDVCASPPTARAYRVLIDRGCFHQIPYLDRAAYARNLLAVCAPDARLLMFVKAFRHGVSRGDAAETERLTREIEIELGGGFAIERRELTYLDPFSGSVPEKALNGLVYWLRRKS